MAADTSKELGMSVATILLIVVAAVAFAVHKSRKSAARVAIKAPPPQPSAAAEAAESSYDPVAGGASVGRPPIDGEPLDISFLIDRWNDRIRERAEGKPCHPRWWWDEPTYRQIERFWGDLESKQLALGEFSPKTKGSYSDLIGWLQPVEESDREILKFFKVPTRDMNETRARYEVHALLSDPEKKARWDGRPPSDEQRECAAILGIELPAGTTHDQAEKLLLKAQKGLPDGDARQKECDAFLDIWNEVMDQEFTEGWEEIRKPTRGAVWKALRTLRGQGRSYVNIQEDLDELVDLLPKKTGR